MGESNTSGFICLMIACNCQLYEWNFSFSFLILNLDLFCIENCHHLFQTSSYKSHNIDCWNNLYMFFILFYLHLKVTHKIFLLTDVLWILLFVFIISLELFLEIKKSGRSLMQTLANTYTLLDIVFRLRKYLFYIIFI